MEKEHYYILKSINSVSRTLWLLCILISVSTIPSHALGKERTVFGAWMMISETSPDGKETPSIYTQYTRCKIFDPDSTYYTVQLHAVGDEMMIIAHEMGRFRLNDSVYMEKDFVMPFEWVDDTTFITTFKGYRERMVRSTMTPERMEEIRALVRKYPNDGDSPVKHYAFSTTERKLKKENKLFLYIIIGMAAFAASVGVGIYIYVYRLQKRKREVERKLAEIEEERTLRPEIVANAMRQVETEFFASEYYQSLRQHIEQGKSLTPNDWKVLEQHLKAVYPHFNNSLFALYNLSSIEYRVCLLTKIRTTPTEISTVLCKDKSTISSIRRRLYKKVFGKEGNGKDWDDFIFSL